MDEYIGCRNCNSPNCKGCNIKTLETMLNNGKFDCLMNENRCINPSADVAPVRHGRWEFKDDDGAYPWTTKAICSECKKVIAWNARLSLKNNQIEFAHENHYCLNCGAIMDGGSD